MNPAVWVARHGRLRPNAPALAEGERVHATWAEFAARVAAAAGGFDLEPGNRVAIVMHNRPEYLEAMFAAWHAGLVVVPVNARLHRDEIAFILEDSGASAVVTDPEHLEDIDAPAIIVTGTQWDRLVAADPAPLVDRRAGRPGVAVLYERYHRAAQGRDAHQPQPADDVPQLLRGHRLDLAARLGAARRAALARVRALWAAAHRPRSRERDR